MNQTLLRPVLIFLFFCGLAGLFFAIKSAFDGDWVPLGVMIPGWLAFAWAAVKLFTGSPSI